MENVKIIGDCKIAQDVVIYGDCYFENCTIESGCKIYSSYIKDSHISKDCTIGPFAHIRPGCHIGENVRVGNFVEIKNSTIKQNTKISHLTYIGDATIGSNCNIGCGVVFCNYDGKNKHKTIIGDNVFVGSNVNLIAPITIDNNCFIAAGSTVTKSVSNDTFVIARAKQENKPKR
jgi:bifunctional UDP-N-acetylglucosamine pyrophosphorylase/glucosamine-1-phosphate N-acetyltransferase